MTPNRANIRRSLMQQAIYEAAEWFDVFHDMLLHDNYGEHASSNAYDDDCAVCGLRAQLQAALVPMEDKTDDG